MSLSLSLSSWAYGVSGGSFCSISLIGFLGTIVDFIATAIENIIYVFGLMAKGTVVMGIAASFVPDVLKVVFVAVVSYSVIINVLNKGG